MRTLVVLSLLLLPAAADELAELKAENARLRELIAKLEAQLEGTAKPINLARTNLASVNASSVNGGRTLSNRYHGVLNCFDAGTNWHNGINYTSWTSDGEPEAWVEVRFDVPVIVHAVEVDGGPPHRVRLFFDAGGEEIADLRTPKPGVRAVRVSFNGDRIRTVNEIRVLGHPPDGVDVKEQAPRILLDRAQALAMARERYEEWRHATLVMVRERVERVDDGWTVVFHRDDLELYRVHVEESGIDEAPLVELKPLR